MSVIFVSGVVLGRLVPPPLGEEIGRRLQSENGSIGHVVFVGHRRIAAQIRLRLGQFSGMRAVRQLDADSVGSFDIVATVSGELKEQIERCGHRLEEIPAGWRQMDVGRFLRAAFTGQLMEHEANKTIGYVAIRN
ncbi:MAG: hypothetical protein NXI27_09575 [Alphaproteobacteria bacterium]|nr:hypothetical protein [Alphaproteobacteria bacterium]